MHFDAESGKLPITATNERMGLTLERLTPALLDRELKNSRLVETCALFDARSRFAGSLEREWLGTCREICRIKGLFSPIL